MSERAEQLKKSIAFYQTLIAKYSGMCEQLAVRRKGATDHVMVEIDARMKVHRSMIEGLHRAITITQEQIAIEERRGGL